MTDINKKLRDFEGKSDKNWHRIISIFRKHLDIWTHKNIKPYWGQMKISYMPVIFNISVDGSTAADIAQKSLIAKQAISRTLKELQQNGMICSKTNSEDRRSEHLELTPEGKKIILEANIEAEKLFAIYKDLVGKKNLDIALTVLKKIIAYHESLHDDEEEYRGD